MHVSGVGSISLFKRNIWRPCVFALKLNIVRAAKCRSPVGLPGGWRRSRLFAASLLHTMWP